jgi:hypothetical protein
MMMMMNNKRRRKKRSVERQMVCLTAEREREFDFIHHAIMNAVLAHKRNNYSQW